MSQSISSMPSDSKTKASVPNNHCIVDVKWGEISYLWTIKHFQQFHCEVNDVLKSTVFSAPTHPEHKWYLKLNLKNTKPAFKDYFGLFVCRDGDNTGDVLVKVKFSLLDGKRNEAFVKQTSKVFRDEIDDWGYLAYISKTKLLDPNPNNELLFEDTLTICCEMKFAVLSSTTTETVQWPEIQSTNNLSKSLECLLHNQDLIDVTFSMNGKNFGAHKSILAARSPVFAAMFKHDMQENRLNEVNITDMDPEVFEEFLRYMYTDKNPDPGMVRDLLIAAEKYDVDNLKLLCEEMIIKDLSIENASDVLVFADLHRAEQLKKQVIFYIKTHPAMVMSTQSWKNTILEHPHLFDDVNGPLVPPHLSVPSPNKCSIKGRRKSKKKNQV